MQRLPFRQRQLSSNNTETGERQRDKTKKLDCNTKRTQKGKMKRVRHSLSLLDTEEWESAIQFHGKKLSKGKGGERTTDTQS